MTGAWDGYPCECRTERRRETLLRSSHISAEFQAMNFQNFDHKERPAVIRRMFAAAVDYRKTYHDIKGQRANSIMLLGQPGSGKTHLLSAVANSLIKENLVRVLYFPYVEGFNELRDDLDALEEKTRAMKQAEVLFIDDLYKGRDKPTQWLQEQIFGVVNYRYQEKKPLLISSERSVDELLEIDEATGSRLVEMAKGHIIEVFGDRKELNYRLAGGL